MEERRGLSASGFNWPPETNLAKSESDRDRRGYGSGGIHEICPSSGLGSYEVESRVAAVRLP